MRGVGTGREAIGPWKQRAYARRKRVRASVACVRGVGTGREATGREATGREAWTSKITLVYKQYFCIRARLRENYCSEKLFLLIKKLLFLRS